MGLREVLLLLCSVLLPLVVDRLSLAHLKGSILCLIDSHSRVLFSDIVQLLLLM